MQISPKSGPNVVQPAGAQAAPVLSSRERAIAKLEASTQQTPVQNPSQVAPEELRAIRAPSTESIGQNTTTEEAPSKSTEAPKTSEESLSTHYANLARKEKQLRAQAQKLRAEQEAFKASQSAKPAVVVDESKFVSRDRLLQDPFSVLNELGLTYDKLTESALNQPKPEELQRQAYERKLEAKLAEIEAKQAAAEKNAQDAQTQGYQQAIAQIRQDTRELVKQNPTAYETISSTSSVNDVVELIERTFNEGLGQDYPKGTILPVETAANMVEEYLIEEALKIAKINKIQQRLRPAAAPQSQAAAKNPSSPQMKTLTNAVSSSRQLSAKERAMLAFEGKLNK